MLQGEQLCTEAFLWPCFYCNYITQCGLYLLFYNKEAYTLFLLLSFPGFNCQFKADAFILASKCIILYLILLNFIPLTLKQCSEQSSCAFCSFSILMMFHSLVTAPILALFSTKICTKNMYMCIQANSYFTFSFHMLVFLYCVLPAVYFWKFLTYVTILLSLVFYHLNMVMA